VSGATPSVSRIGSAIAEGGQHVDDSVTTTIEHDGSVDAASTHDDPRVARTHDAVHEAGRQLLVESGPAAVTHAAIATAARLSRTTLYKYWPTRFELLAEICHAAKPDAMVMPTGDVRTDLVQMTSRVAENFADRESLKMFVSMLAQSQWDDDARSAQAAMIGVGISDLAAILEAGEQSGQLPSGIDPRHAATRLLGPLFFGATVLDDDRFRDGEPEAIVDDWLASIRD